MNELFEFSAEEETAGPFQKNWVVLSVEDNQPYQDVLESALQEVVFEGRKIEILRASSAASAATILSKRQDISVILLELEFQTVWAFQVPAVFKEDPHKT